MTAKETFLQNESDVKFILSVTKNSAFDRAVIFAKQAWQERTTPATNPILAINEFLDVLRDLPIDAPPDAGLPARHMHHDLDVKPRLPKTPKKGKK